MKEVAVIAFEKSYAEYIKACVEVYFGNAVKIKAYSAAEIDRKEYIDEKYIVLSGFIIFKEVYKKIKKNSVLQVIHFTLSKKQAGAYR